MFLSSFLRVDPWLLGSVSGQGQGTLGSIPPGGLGPRLGDMINVITNKATKKSARLYWDCTVALQPLGPCDHLLSTFCERRVLSGLKFLSSVPLGRDLWLSENVSGEG